MNSHLYMNFYDLDLLTQSRLVGEIYRLYEINKDLDKSMLKILLANNIICPHFSQYRTYGGYVEYMSVYKWFDCGLCGSTVLSPTFCKNIFSQEKAIENIER